MHDAAAAVSERLRQTYTEWNNPPSAGLPDGAKVLLDAADEIDRLRASQAGGVPAGWRDLIEEIDAELDRQLYDEEYVRQCRNNDLDVPSDCEHHIIIREALRSKIAKAAASPPPPATDGGLTIADYERAFEDHKRLVRRLDVLLNGEAGAAPQASLCDIVGQLEGATRNAVPATDGDALREALAPFARLITAFEADLPDDTMVRVLFGNTVSGELRVSDLRRAKDALASSPVTAPQSDGDVLREALTFEAFSTANRNRCEAADGFNHPLGSWTASDWVTAIVGELGEAANIVKKLNRYRDNIPGNKETADALIIAMMRYAKEHGHTSMCMNLMEMKLNLPTNVVGMRPQDIALRNAALGADVSTEGGVE